MALWNELELKDYLLIPISLAVILVAFSNLAGDGSLIFEAIASSKLSRYFGHLARRWLGSLCVQAR
jgi:hypothetical protein